MRFSPNLKKIVLISTIVLLSCDVSLLFAAQTDNQKIAAENTEDPQVQQLKQVQAQIKALQSSSPASATNPAIAPNNTPAVPSSKNDPLPPPVPFTPSDANTSLSSVPALPPPVIPASPITPSSSAQTPNIPPPAYQPQTQTNPDVTGAENKTVQETPVTENDLNDAAFNTMVQNALPMSPAQIQKLRSVYMASQFAATNLPTTPPRPVATSAFVDLSPGSTPPVVRLAQGFISSLVFVDSTGAPWQIEAYDIGNPSAFNIQWDKTGNTLMIQSTVLYTYGNLAVKLKGLNTPVMITLVPGQKAVDYRVDLRIQGYGPNATARIENILPPSTSSDLLNVLDGIPPPNSKILKVEGGNCQAWLSGDKMYVRTRLSVLSPGWTATLSSADGMHAYQMQQTPMLLVSQNGQVIQLKVEGF